MEIEYREPGMPKSKEVLVNWTNPIGILNWTIPFVVPEFPEDYTEISVCALASARNEIGRWSNNTELCYHVGRVNITLESPSGTGELEGLVQVSGLFQSIYNATIEWRLDNEEWEFGAFYDDGWGEEVHIDGRETTMLVSTCSGGIVAATVLLMIMVGLNGASTGIRPD